MTVHRLNERYERIARAYKVALGPRTPASTSVRDLLPAIFAEVPDTSIEEIVAALRWSARKDLRHADKLEQWGRER